MEAIKPPAGRPYRNRSAAGASWCGRALRCLRSDVSDNDRRLSPAPLCARSKWWWFSLTTRLP